MKPTYVITGALLSCALRHALLSTISIREKVNSVVEADNSGSYSTVTNNHRGSNRKPVA